MHTEKAHDFFISYKSEDVDFVRPLCERLLAEGYSPWFNEYQVRHDQIDEFQLVVNEGVDCCEWGILFVNAYYNRSPYCHVEVERLLRRRPVERIIVLALGNELEFLKMYPELKPSTIRVGSREEAYRRLCEAGLIRELPDPIELEVDSSPKRWPLKEIGAEFDPNVWRVDHDSLMRGSVWHDQLDITGRRREDYHTFSASLQGHRIKLWMDYRLVKEPFANRIADRIRVDQSADGTLLFVENEADDRKRLLEELRDFPNEIEVVTRLVLRSADVVKSFYREEPPSKPVVEEIGVHMFSTTERQGSITNSYKHRLFSFCLPELGAIFRVYKLVLPHPQSKDPVVIYFIFQFEDDRQAFFGALPWSDYVVRSFRWLTLATIPSLDIHALNKKAEQINGDSNDGS